MAFLSSLVVPLEIIMVAMGKIEPWGMPRSATKAMKVRNVWDIVIPRIPRTVMVTDKIRGLLRSLNGLRVIRILVMKDTVKKGMKVA